jgi:hypothetical protein
MAYRGALTESSGDRAHALAARDTWMQLQMQDLIAGRSGGWQPDIIQIIALQ